MIIDSIKNISNYQILVPIARQILDFLESTDLSKLNKKVNITDSLVAIPIRGDKSNDKSNILEAHRIWSDIHYTISGKDKIIYKPVDQCLNIFKEYLTDEDYVLFNESEVDSLTLCEGLFCVIDPSMAHNALIGEKGSVYKIVFKYILNNI